MPENCRRLTDWYSVICNNDFQMMTPGNAHNQKESFDFYLRWLKLCFEKKQASSGKPITTITILRTMMIAETIHLMTIKCDPPKTAGDILCREEMTLKQKSPWLSSTPTVQAFRQNNWDWPAWPYCLSLNMFSRNIRQQRKERRQRMAVPQKNKYRHRCGELRNFCRMLKNINLLTGNIVSSPGKLPYYLEIVAPWKRTQPWAANLLHDSMLGIMAKMAWKRLEAALDNWRICSGLQTFQRAPATHALTCEKATKNEANAWRTMTHRPEPFATIPEHKTGYFNTVGELLHGFNVTKTYAALQAVIDRNDEQVPFPVDKIL